MALEPILFNGHPAVAAEMLRHSDRAPPLKLGKLLNPPTGPELSWEEGYRPNAVGCPRGARIGCGQATVTRRATAVAAGAGAAKALLGTQV